MAHPNLVSGSIRSSLRLLLSSGLLTRFSLSRNASHGFIFLLYCEALEYIHSFILDVLKFQQDLHQVTPPLPHLVFLHFSESFKTSVRFEVSPRQFLRAAVALHLYILTFYPEVVVELLVRILVHRIILPYKALDWLTGRLVVIFFLGKSQLRGEFQNCIPIFLLIWGDN